MEELGRGPGCSLSLSGIVLSAHAGQACQDVGMEGWMGESGPGSLEWGQGAGVQHAPLCLPLLLREACLGCVPRCRGSASPPTGGLEAGG